MRTPSRGLMRVLVWLPNGLEMSRPASQGKYRAKLNAWLAGSAPSSC